MRFASDGTNDIHSSFVARLVRVFADGSHGVSLARPADDLLHHVMGAGGGRGTVFSAQRTQPGVGGAAVTQRLQ